MSRRVEKAWQDLLAKHRFVAGEDEETLWRRVASEVGLSPEDFTYPGEGFDTDGHEEVDINSLSVAAKDMFFGGYKEAPPVVMITLKCQRCDRRIDTWRVRGTRWSPPERDSDGPWTLENPVVTSEAWANEIGDSTFRLFEFFKDRPMTFSCVCGVRNIQFSARRIRDTIESLMPDKPPWSRGTRHATIRG